MTILRVESGSLLLVWIPLYPGQAPTRGGNALRELPKLQEQHRCGERGWNQLEGAWQSLSEDIYI